MTQIEGKETTGKINIFNIGSLIVRFFSILFLGLLAISGLFIYVKAVDWNEWFRIFKDPIYTIGSLIVFLLVFLLISKLFSLIHKDFIKEIICVVFLIIAFVFLLKTNPYPAGDQEFILWIINYLKKLGPYNERLVVNDTMYEYLFKYYTDECGNVVNNVMFQYIFPNYLSFYIYNFILYVLTLHFWIKLMKILKLESNQIDTFMILYSLCSPIFLYTCFFYGEITAIFGITLSIYYIVKLFNDEFKKDCILDLIKLFIVNFIMVLEKESSLIFVIAEILSLFLYIFNKSNKEYTKKIIALVLTITISTSLVSSAVSIFANSFNLKKGATDLSGFIAMGMHDNVSDGKYLETTGIGIEGGFDGTNRKYCQDEVSGEYKLKSDAELDHSEDISYSINNFIKHPTYAARFCFNKIIKQWNSNDFNTGPNVRHISYYNTITVFDKINMFLANGERMFIYLLAFVLVVLNKNDEDNKGKIASTILIVLFIGNFLFSIIWEAKPRYCIYGYYALLLYVTLNCANLFEIIKSKLKSLRN